MGAVFLAEEVALGRQVAIKMVSRRLASDAQSKSRFMREARTLATIEHPHVVRVYSFGEINEDAYLVLEYVEGETLAERIGRVGKLPLQDALRITRQTLDALEAAWERKVIHRDIKPSNILIDRRHAVRVADFGLAKPIQMDTRDVGLTQTGYMLGTPHYISPEQAQGKEIDFRSDIYSVGIMLYHMLAGERPFEGSTPVAIVAKHLQEPLPSLRSKRADVPPDVERLIRWMTEKEPELRPDSYPRLIEAVDQLLGATPARALPSVSTVPVEQPQRGFGILSRDLSALSGRAWVGIALIVLFVAGVFTVSTSILRERRRSAGVTTKTASTDSRLVVAIAPFYGPDDDSLKEGRVMAALIERSVEQRLGRENARVLGIDETKSVVRDHDSARELGEKLHANAVIWGEAFALRKETEIQPHITIIASQKPAAAEAESKSEPAAFDRSVSLAGSMAALEQKSSAPVRVQAEAPNQIELRKTSASGIGDVVLLLAGIHALETQHAPAKALDLFRQAPRSPETLLYQVQALLQLGRNDEARKILEESVVAKPNDAASQALLGDLYLVANRIADAVTSYQKAVVAGQPYSTTRGFMDHGLLYIKETYRTDWKADVETIYLLGIDPQSQKVLVRYPLPGIPTRFDRKDDSVIITFNAARDDRPLPSQIVFTSGKFDRPLWPPANLLWRSMSLRAGRVLATNFVEQLQSIRTSTARAQFTLARTINQDFPTTLPSLEAALRNASLRDPTQPWHLFFLALTLREEHKVTEAEPGRSAAELHFSRFPAILRREGPEQPVADTMVQQTQASS